MIISKTPYRISFFGGGTDYPAWYQKEGGAVLSTTIDKFCYISCRTLPPFFNLKHRIVWSHIETVSSITEILHPAVREGLKYLEFEDQIGLEIHHQGDLPARAGMGSSSAFAVGLIKALYALKGKLINKKDLAIQAIELEQKILKENVGSQDQIAASYGGFNVITLSQKGDFVVEPMTIKSSFLEELQDHFVMYYTGTSRLASEIAGNIIQNIPDKTTILKTMRGYVDQAIDILSNNNIEQFGKLLHENWQLKKQLSHDVSNENIDRIYQTALEHGAWGGKLLGAGSSGFILFCIPPEKQQQLHKALAGYLHVPFNFEFDGSSLIYYKPAEDKINL